MGELNTKMTALADEIRELSGTTTTKSIDTMTSDVDAANTEITEQTDLIAQITTALEGKASGGSGDGSVETCTVTVNSPDGSCYIGVTRYINGNFVSYSGYPGLDNPITVSNVVCGSCLTVITYYDTYYDERSNVTNLGDMRGCPVYSIDAPANGTANITIYSDD